MGDLRPCNGSHDDWTGQLDRRASGVRGRDDPQGSGRGRRPRNIRRGDRETISGRGSHRRRLANVLTVARENADAASLGDRYHTIAGSAFDVDLGEGYDLVLLTNFLHHFAIPECEDFLRKVRTSMAPGGRVITLEFVPNDDRISPASADFALIMLVTTPGGDAYTFKEWDSMFQNAGFGRSELHAVPKSKEHIIITHLST